MPRVFSLEDTEIDEEAFDDEDYDPFAVPPEEFQYLDPPDMGGPQGEVRVAIQPEQVGKVRKGIFDRFRRQDTARDAWRQQADLDAATLAAGMAALGAVRAVARYDGGNDEGFAWFDHCVMRDGSIRDADRMAADLQAAGVRIASRLRPSPPMRDVLDDIAAGCWAVALLGQSFGTGAYVMYGACSVDLTTGVVTDDPDPAPIVQNIRFGPA